MDEVIANGNGQPSPTTTSAPNSDLGSRIARAQARQQRMSATPTRDRTALTASAVAWRMLTDLLAGIVVGFGAGWGIDSWLETKPVFLIAFGLLGVAGGIRLAMRSAKAVEPPPPNNGNSEIDQ